MSFGCDFPCAENISSTRADVISFIFDMGPNCRESDVSI